MKRQAMSNSSLVAEHAQRWGNINQKVETLTEWMDMLPKLQDKIDKLWE